MLLVFLGTHHNPREFLTRFAPAVTPLEASSAPLPDGRVGPAARRRRARLPLSPLRALSVARGVLCRRAVRARVRARAPPGAVDLHRLRRLGARRRGDRDGAKELGVGRLSFGRGVRGVRLGAAARPDVVHPGRRRGSDGRDPYPVLYIVDHNLPRPLANLVAVVIGGAMWLCGLSSITSMGRMWYAFARDGGMPGSRLLRRIHSRWRTPVPAILVTSALAVAICVYAAAVPVITSISTIALYLAYGLPILLNLANRFRGRGEFATPDNAPWSLGPFRSAPERRRDRLGGLHHRGVLPPAERARPLDDALLLCLARHLLARFGATDVPGTGRRLNEMLDPAEKRSGPIRRDAPGGGARVSREGRQHRQRDPQHRRRPGSRPMLPA